MSRGPARSGRSSSARSRARAGKTGASRLPSGTRRERCRGTAGGHSGLARRPWRRQRRAGRGRLLAPSGGGARPGRRVSGGPHPGRGLFRYRRDPRSGRPAAAHAAVAGALRARRLGARDRQRLSRRGLRHGGPLQRGARLVDVPRVRARGRLGPRRRPAALAGGRPSGRERGARDRAGIVHGGGARRHPGPLVRAGPGDPRFRPGPDRGRPPPGALHGCRSGAAARSPRAGHIPGSRSVPFDAVLDDDDAALGEAATIRRAFADASVDPARPVIATCGSGITACTLALALAAIGAGQVAVYDGSWTDWGGHADAPVESGEPA